MPARNELGSQPIHWAASGGHVPVVDLLLEAGASIDATDNKGCSPLITSSQYGQTNLTGYLLGRGARYQLVDREGDNALHWAAFKGNANMSRLLIYSGFNPKQRKIIISYILNVFDVLEKCKIISHIQTRDQTFGPYFV